MQFMLCVVWWQFIWIFHMCSTMTMISKAALWRISRDCLALWMSQPLLDVGKAFNLRNYTRLYRALIINHVLCKVSGVPWQFERWPVRENTTNVPGRGLYKRSNHPFHELTHGPGPYLSTPRCRYIIIKPILHCLGGLVNATCLKSHE